MRVLVVGDDAEALASFTALLNRMGHDVTLAGTVDAARAVLLEFLVPVTVIIRSPASRIGALAVCRELRATPRGESTLILLAADQATPTEIIDAMDAGIDDFLLHRDDSTDVAVRLAAASQRFERRLAFRDAMTQIELARREAEQSIRQSQELHRRILETVAVGIVVFDTTGAVTQANAEARRILDLGPGETAPRFVADFEPEVIWEDGTPCPIEEYPVTRCLATKEVQPPVTIGVRRRDGEFAWAVYTAAPLIDPDTDESIGAIVSFLDITESKRTEQALRQSEERLRQAQKMEAIGRLLPMIRSTRMCRRW
jgi:PAS domain-containing protein